MPSRSHSMHRFRQTLLGRLLALGLLVGLTVGIGAPLAAAHPQAAAAQLARTHAAGPVEKAVAEALIEAARAQDGVAAFQNGLIAALAAHPDGEALADYIREAGSPEALLDLLVGQLLRGVGTPTPLFVAAPALTSAAASGSVRAVMPASDRAPPFPTAATLGPVAQGSEVVVSLRTLSSAQPLGP